MKKNISINISGIIFHIEEDGYERLDGYLKSIKQYFSAFDESEEIILDIENRVAEIFLAKLNDGKQVITAEDVDSLIRTMGNVSDFQAVEDGDQQEPLEEEPVGAETGTDGGREDKKLYRDRSRQIIGGVAAGIAHYLRVDPLWIRLVFLIMMADLAVTRAFAPVVFIAYLVLWAILPGRFDLQEDKRVKKIYRDPDGQVLGGVAAGIANYFGVSVVSIRILFVLFILLGGAGFFVYIVLWIIVPPAKTVTEKLEMKGEPVTLENIENNIKGGLRMNPEEDESIFTKILLFPFRLMAEVIGILGRIASPFFRFLLEVIRVAAGVFIILMSLGFLYALVVAIALWAGAEGWWMLPFWWEDARITLSNDLNWMVIRDTLTFWIAIPAFVAGLIPVLFYMLLGVAALAKRWVARPLVGWSLFGIWVLSLITLAISVPRFWYEFREEGDDITTTTLPALQDRTMTIMADGFQTNGEIDLVDLYIYPTDDPELRLERKVHTRGRDNDNIKENAAMVLYDVSVNDSVLTIPREIAFAEGAVFRGQEVDISLYIPKGQAFYLDKNLRGLLSYRRRFDSGLGHTYLFDEDGRRLCVDCEQPYPESASERRQGIEYRIGSEGRALNMELEEFDELILRGNISVVLEQGEENRLEVAAGSDPRSLNVRLVEDRLYVEQEEETYGRGLEVILNATDFTGLVLEEQVEADLVSFVGEDLEVVVANSSVLNGALEVGALEVRVEDEARIRLTGSAKALNLTARDRSSFRSYELYAEDADVDATHRAEVRLRATQALTVNSSSDITVRYRGNPESVNVRGKVREVEEE